MPIPTLPLVLAKVAPAEDDRLVVEALVQVNIEVVRVQEVKLTSDVPLNAATPVEEVKEVALVPPSAIGMGTAWAETTPEAAFRYPVREPTYKVPETVSAVLEA